MHGNDKPAPEGLLHLASLGEVLGGFSHEMAQPLNAVMIASQVIQMKVQRSFLPEEEKTYIAERLEIISSQVRRASQMIQSLRLFSHGGTPYSGRTSIKEIFERIYELMRNQFLQRGIDLSLECPDRLPAVKEDLHLIESILVQGLAFARDSVDAIAQRHAREDAPYHKGMTVKLNADTGSSGMEIEWGLGILPATTVLIDPKINVGLVTADLVLRSRGGIMRTSASGVLTRIPCNTGL